MYCPNCGAEIIGAVKFCPECGNKLPDTPAEAVNAAPVDQQQPQQQPVTGSFEPPAQSPGVPVYYSAPAADMTAPAPASEYGAPVVSEKKKKEYKKTSTAKKAVSLALILMAFLFGFISLAIASIRIGLAEGNVRTAFRENSLSDITINITSGKETLVDIMQESIVDVQGRTSVFDEDTVESFLEKPYVNQFAEDILADYVGYLIFKKTPENLNSDAICRFLEKINVDLRHETGYYIPDDVIEDIRVRIDDGDLSYLSVEPDKGTVKINGLNLGIVPAMFSVWTMLIFGGLAVIFILLVFFINKGNPPAAFGFVSIALIVFGALNSLLALAVFIIGTSKNAFFSTVINYIAMGIGTISLIILAVGIILFFIRKLLKKNSVTVKDSD